MPYDVPYDNLNKYNTPQSHKNEFMSTAPINLYCFLNFEHYKYYKIYKHQFKMLIQVVLIYDFFTYGLSKSLK